MLKRTRIQNYIPNLHFFFFHINFHVYQSSSNYLKKNINKVNKRLDEWVTEEYLDTRKVQFPRKDGTTTGQNTGVTTPKKLIQSVSIPTTSRPTSPLSGNELVNGSAVLAAAINKKMNRKRKV